MKYKTRRVILSSYNGTWDIVKTLEKLVKHSAIDSLYLDKITRAVIYLLNKTCRNSQIMLGNDLVWKYVDLITSRMSQIEFSALLEEK